MTLRQRIGRLEAARASVEGPRVIYICGPDGDSGGALIIGGGCLEREGGEAAEAFASWAERAAEAARRI
jgi:hypothetical protein